MNSNNWAPRIFSPRTWPTRTRVIAVSTALILVLGGAGTAYALSINRPDATPPQSNVASTPRSTATQAPTTPTPTPVPVPVPRTAVAADVVAGWRVATRSELAAVLPQVGASKDGDVALSIDAPVVESPRAAFAASVAVTPETAYTFRGWFRMPVGLPVDVPATLHIGADSITIPDLDATWQELVFPYGTGAGETSVDISLTVDGPVRGLDVDALSFAASGEENLLPNPSFEDVGAEWGIRNDSLILQQQTAALAVRMAAGPARWSARTLEGAEVASGEVELRDHLSAISLDGLGQGYFQLAVTDAAGQTIETQVGLVTMSQARVPVDTRVGVHVHQWRDFYADAPIAAAALGFGMVRVDDNWQNSEPAPGQYTFDPLIDEYFAEADSQGQDKLLTTGRTNRSYDGGGVPRSQAALDAYGRYSAALVQHFSADAVEIFNEFNIPAFNKGPCGLNAGCYAPILNAAHDAIKAVKPDLPVVGGVTGNFDRPWFRELWANGGIENLDASSFHPYQLVPGNPEGIDVLTRDARADMKAAGSVKPIWLTELGWTSKTGGGVGVSTEQQGNMLVRAQVSALASGVERFIWYDLINDTNNPTEHEGNFGLYRQKQAGVAAMPPKPAAFSQALLLNALAGKPFKTAETPGDGIKSYVFGEGDASVRIAWSVAGEKVVEYPAVGPVTVVFANGSTSVVNPEGGKVRISLRGNAALLSGTTAP